jgi:hypothetical protein
VKNLFGEAPKLFSLLIEKIITTLWSFNSYSSTLLLVLELIKTTFLIGQCYTDFTIIFVSWIYKMLHYYYQMQQKQ